ncbi:MAG TPA: conserved phage C-terminal domain-containing protein, partial [Paraburkholderia sp.]|uniref:conserved phage C-terminal domain-containing protein n=1 Tax=Paraburkholderia sp. TaxID=1926495 RepID=UPI002B4895D3
LWSAVNESASKDNFVKGITLFEVDAMAGVPGFGDALVTVGWAEVRHDGVIFPNFDEHNTTEKARSDKGSGPKTAAQRTREWRERKASQNVTENVTENVTRDVTIGDESDVTVTPREEKRREDKKHISSDVTDVLDYLNVKAGRKFEAVQANTKLIVARMKEGATVEQMKAVVDAKVRDWLHDPKMNEFLRPATLFNAEKFGQYSGALGSRVNGFHDDSPFA